MCGNRKEHAMDGVTTVAQCSMFSTVLCCCDMFQVNHLNIAWGVED